jgi:hypothetical protein
MVISSLSEALFQFSPEEMTAILIPLCKSIVNFSPFEDEISDEINSNNDNFTDYYQNNGREIKSDFSYIIVHELLQDKMKKIRNIIQALKLSVRYLDDDSNKLC